MSTKPRTIGFRIDIETKSSTDIKSGVYRYAEDPDFEVLLLAYSPIRRFPGGGKKLGAVRLLDLTDERAVAAFQRILADDRFQKHAYNAAFERVALSRWLGMGNGEFLDPANWHCSAIRANVSGVFGTLDEVGRALRTSVQKDAAGKALIKFFSIPIPAREKRNCSCDTFHSPAVHPEKFAEFGSYCINDVVTEAMVAASVPDIPKAVQHEYEADQRINDRGVRHFRTLAERAVEQVEVERDRLMGELKDMTGLDNPNSGPQFKGWLEEQNYPMASLDKAHREDALSDPMIPDAVAAALNLKGKASLSSVSKHKAALKTRCTDGRIRGSLQFYGAHTGREAGRGIQPQNLPRPPKKEVVQAAVKALLLGTAGPDAPLFAKQTVRSSLVPAKGHVFVVLDYNSIEARVLGWLCGERWVEDEFRGEGKFYEATAATMFGVDKDKLVAALKQCDKCGSCVECGLRARGKVAALALGYAGGAGALVTMGAEKEGIDVGNYNELHALWVAEGKPGKFFDFRKSEQDWPELLRLRDLYRDSSPMTVRFWKLCAKAWDVSATEGQASTFGQNQILSFLRDGKNNRMALPSGRSIWYRRARSIPDPEVLDRIDRRTFLGKSKGVGHMWTDTHGGKLCENVTQAVARDVLFDLIMKVEDLTAAGWPGRIVLHVHDEVVLEVPTEHAEQVLDDVLGLMSSPPDWAHGLPVRGEGDIMERYGK